MELTDKQLLELYNIVWCTTHSDGFKKSEIECLLFEPTYWFLIKPIDGWKDKLIEYLISIDYDVSKTTLNKY